MASSATGDFKKDRLGSAFQSVPLSLHLLLVLSCRPELTPRTLSPQRSEKAQFAAPRSVCPRSLSVRVCQCHAIQLGPSAVSLLVCAPPAT
ncbi:hypothetical protein CDEST_12217 [Colletotrichum destructivum]|uniref:Uncharacterized protein n=1 Tax=Colletotrichum destructivum TaxID=34406 RepID=A0AAX4IVR8_9PEZI|nr:hypothetical protein CDEST_12217 [Colletotrichum destructivum]